MDEPSYGIGTLVCYKGKGKYSYEHAIIIGICPIAIALDPDGKEEWHWQYEMHYLKPPRFSFYETEKDFHLLMEEGKVEILSPIVPT